MRQDEKLIEENLPYTHFTLNIANQNPSTTICGSRCQLIYLSCNGFLKANLVNL
jgi:hypothetical protein